jgi:hypothetical protein
MFTRRTVACACALALAVPAAASAHVAIDPPNQTTSHTVYGDTKYDLQNQQDLSTPTGTANVYVSPAGDTKNDVKPSYADRVGSLTAAQLAAAYGTTQPKAAPAAPALSTHRVVVPAGKGVGALAVVNQKQLPLAHGGRLHPAKVDASTGDGPDGWQIAAVAEAGLLAAFALGAATFVGRMRPRRGATA